MRDVYDVLRQKELEVSRLRKELAALRVAAPLLSEDDEADNDDNDDKPTNPNHSGWEDKAKKH